MSDKLPVYNVVIAGHRVDLRKIEPGGPGYRKAKKKVILRQRDAVERYQNLKKRGGDFDGVHSFQFLDSARTFALLSLGYAEQRIQENLDKVLGFDGSRKAGKR